MQKARANGNISDYRAAQPGVRLCENSARVLLTFMISRRLPIEPAVYPPSARHQHVQAVRSKPTFASRGWSWRADKSFGTPTIAITRVRLYGNTVKLNAARPVGSVFSTKEPCCMGRFIVPKPCATLSWRGRRRAGRAWTRCAMSATMGSSAQRVIRRPRLCSGHFAVIGPTPHALVA